VAALGERESGLFHAGDLPRLLESRELGVERLALLGSAPALLEEGLKRLREIAPRPPLLGLREQPDADQRSES
jgi:hypothetical protein